MDTAIKSNADSSDLQSIINNPSVQFMPKCLLCDKTFANTSNLKHHMNTIHYNEAKWICKECGKVCTSKSNLKVHLRVHLRVKPYYCRWCDYNCMHHSSIRDHLSKCHPEKSHNSCEPGYIFNSAAVPEPELSHFEEKIFKKIDLLDYDSTKLTIKDSTQTNDAKNEQFNLTLKNDFDFCKQNLKKKFDKIEIKTIDDHEELNQEDDNIDDKNNCIEESYQNDLDDKHDTDLNQFASNIFQQPTDMLNNIFPNSSSSSSSRSSITSGNCNFNNIAANLLQRLNVVLMQQCSNNQNLQNSKEIFSETRQDCCSNALDLSIKTNDRKRCKLNENCHFYVSDESPVSPVSSISSSSSTTKTSNSSQTICSNSKNNNSKKAISDVINRLNSSKTLLSRKRNSTTLLLNEKDDQEIDDNEEENKNSEKKCSDYKCTYCNIVFNEYPLYSIHAGMHSNSNPWKCSVCGHVCTNKIDFAVHILHLSKI
ncbi:unnamed protein product [Brachionus calyciflorus]|uniref:C2H2-type domain-containing protein n=1 Tax=Brachionus calyciflorus TaxID=104777 RepID=A0A813YC13_9BILA|nr:unnamed protein product [Brachionus calyciflorus]